MLEKLKIYKEEKRKLEEARKKQKPVFKVLPEPGLLDSSSFDLNTYVDLKVV